MGQWWWRKGWGQVQRHPCRLTIISGVLMQQTCFWPSQKKSVQLHVSFSRYLYLCVQMSTAGEKGWEGTYRTLCSPIAGWLMKHSTHHAASVTYQENDNPFPTPNPNTHCSQFPVFVIVRLYVWEWISHKYTASNKVKTFTFIIFHATQKDKIQN